MSGQQYLSALSENATRLGMRLQESISEHTRDLSITRGSGASYLDLSDDKTKNIRKQLESSSDREKLDAMKRLVALISKGRNATEYFAAVVKNVASPNLEIRKLVYIYLLKYAEHEPDLALLSINTFQKDLGDSSPLIRGMALRVLSGIKVPMVGSLVVLAIKKCAGDMSPYVRKGAALAVPKCYDLDNTHLPALIEIITTLLQDRSPLSLGAVTVAFEAVCSTRLDLLHKHFRRFCKLLVEMDEWGQVQLMNLLLRYARTMLPRPIWKEGLQGDTGAEEDELDKDLKLLLDSVKPVFQSRNPAVILAATRVLFYAGPPSYWNYFINPLLRLLPASKEVERVVLADLLILSKKESHLFAPHYNRFLVRSDDFTQVKTDKIHLLLNVLNQENHVAIMREFIDYAEDVNDSVVIEAINGLGHCAIKIPECLPQCLTSLITMIKSRHDIVVSSTVLVLKRLVQRQLSNQAAVNYASTSQSPLSIIAHLARRIDDIKHAQARACVVWLVGQYGASEEPTPGPEGLAAWAPDVLRRLAKSFATEASSVKLQVINLAAKLFVLSPTDRTISLLAKYIFSQSRYDVNYDVRDRGRMLSSLLVGVGLELDEVSQGERTGVVLRREQVKLVLFDGKVITGETDRYTVDEKVLVGTLGRVTGKLHLRDSILPDWLERGVESSLRDSEYDAPPPPPVLTALSSSGMAKARNILPGVQSPIVLTPTTGTSPIPGTKGKGAWTDLDAFYANNDEEDEESSGDEEESEEEDTSGGEPGSEEAQGTDEEDEEQESLDGSSQSDSEKASKHTA